MYEQPSIYEYANGYLRLSYKIYFQKNDILDSVRPSCYSLLFPSNGRAE